ncbi:MAG TPA: argininosuccinate lyase [Bacteroidales bacterium]|nr:argininosuccinate lyase [Bacteroidales bacterium]
MKLWEKGQKTNTDMMEFTAGRDRELDLQIAAVDVIGSMAHVIMLQEVGLIAEDDKLRILKTLLSIYGTVKAGKFFIEDGVEDVHSQVENLLTRELGDAGKRVHTARSRNDQVITDLKLYYRENLTDIVSLVNGLVNTLIEKSAETKDDLIPGYTHFQVAMPSSLGMWFGSYAEALTEDLMMVRGAFSYTNQNPLGSAAGYGSSFPVDRDLTSRLLEFDDLHVNSVNAQLSRGKTEKFLMSALSSVAYTLSKMAMDLVLYMSQNFDFIRLSEDLTTGSSIMPHKKNPDVLELIRARCNRVQSKEFEVMSVINNLPSGYHRDFQLLKEICFPAVSELKECLQMITFIIPNLIPNKDVLSKEIYQYVGSVDAINERVKEGLPFRDAYVQVASEIDKGRFRPGSQVKTTHTGSIGNLSNDRIVRKLERIIPDFQIEKYATFQERFVEDLKKKLT